ncbi:MAG: hypothetical protein Kow0074_18040 [Candidatus Zixiibacteriota bacterium]
MNQRNVLKILGMRAIPSLLVTWMAVTLCGDPVSAQLLEPPSDVSTKPNAEFQVGTYDPQRAFQAHPAYGELMQVMQTAQMQMQQAQQSGDQMKIQQIQQQFEQTRNAVATRFQDDIAARMPTVAKVAGVELVAAKIVYTADNVGTKDLTDLLIDAFGDSLATDHPAALNHAEDVTLDVGVYDPEAVFQSHPALAELNQATGVAQMQMQQAQQAGDQMKMQQIQMEHQQTRNRVIGEFEQDIVDALPAIAKDAGIKVAVMQMVYAAEDVDTTSITAALIGALGEGSSSAGTGQ